MGTIVTIGGGTDVFGSAPAIEKELVAMTGKAKPHVLILPTASSDGVEYIEALTQRFEELGCVVDVLKLVSESPSQAVIQYKILNTDLIYVGGGDTRMMVKVWRQRGVDHVLKDAYHRGIILAGLSAGSNCWYQYSHSDSESFHNKEDWKFIMTSCLGFIQAVHVPHYNEPGRDTFDEFYKAYPTMPGIALENGVAMIYEGSKARIFKENNHCKAYVFTHVEGLIQKHELHEDDVLELEINI